MPLILGANTLSAGGYEVDNSLRFNYGSSDYLERTSTSGNRRTFTFSTWIKRGGLTSNNAGGYDTFFSSDQAVENSFRVTFNDDDGSDDDRLMVYFYTGSFQLKLITSQVFRDMSAWYHIVVAVDTTQATDTNRVKIYVNGSQVTSFLSTLYPSQNTDTSVNQSGAPCRVGAGTSLYFNGYMSDVYLIDGQQLAPSDFGEFDSDSGIWKPIAYTGTYGTNGFYLEFKDSSALGDDTSGNGNDFTVNNLTSIDQTTDTPTNNFCTLNPLQSGSITFSDGNLTQGNTSATGQNAISTIGASSGKWYAEVKCTAVGSNGTLVGFINLDLSNLQNDTIAPGQDNFSAGLYSNNGPIFYQSETTFATVGSTSDGDIIQLAMDLDNGYLYWGRNGTWLNSADPESGGVGTGGLATSNLGLGDIGFGMWQRNSASASWNYGNPPFTISSGNADANGYGNFEYAVPSGYYALNTKNLAEYG
jgi:hypothetical protein